MSATTAAVTECAGLSCVTKLGGPQGRPRRRSLFLRHPRRSFFEGTGSPPRARALRALPQGPVEPAPSKTQSRHPER
jgi:hypothetical protein